MSDLRRLRPTIRLWTAYLAVGVLAMLAHALLEPGSAPQNLLYDVVGASAVVITLLAVRRYRPERPAPWLLMATGQAMFVAGDLVWNWYEWIGQDPFPSVADVLYLAGYPFIAAGLLLLIRRRLSGGDRAGLLDAAILTTAVGILSWTFLIQPQVGGGELDPVALGITLAYPLGDLLLIGVAMGLLTTPGARTTSFRLLGTSLALLFVADQAYLLQTIEGTYAAGGLLDSVYLLAYLAFGAAAAHPSMRRLTDPHPVAVTWLGPARLIGLAAAMLTGPLLVSVGPSGDSGLVVVAVGSAVLSLLVLARLAGLVGLLERDVAARRVLEAKLSYQAHHDPLTGLANHRQFVDRASAALASRREPGRIGILFLDLDDFKTVNDQLGHAAGDALLIAVAERIRGALRADDVASRLGGDEFGILLPDVADLSIATAIAERLLLAFDRPVELPDATVTVGASIGIALDLGATVAVEGLLRDADVAMYRAKAVGKGRYEVFAGASALAGDPAGDRATATKRRWVDRVTTIRRQPGGSRLEAEAG